MIGRSLLAIVVAVAMLGTDAVIVSAAALCGNGGAPMSDTCGCRPENCPMSPEAGLTSRCCDLDTPVSPISAPSARIQTTVDPVPADTERAEPPRTLELLPREPAEHSLPEARALPRYRLHCSYLI